MSPKNKKKDTPEYISESKRTIVGWKQKNSNLTDDAVRQQQQMIESESDKKLDLDAQLEAIEKKIRADQDHLEQLKKEKD